MGEQRDDRLELNDETVAELDTDDQSVEGGRRAAFTWGPGDCTNDCPGPLETMSPACGEFTEGYGCPG